MLKKSKLSELAEIFQYFILDCDGVIWEGNSQIGNSRKALEFLLERKKQIFIFTNNSHKSRSSFIQKTQNVLNLNIPSNCWYNTARTTARYIKKFHPKFDSAYIVGGPGIFEELNNVGIKNIWGYEDSHKLYDENKFWEVEYKKKMTPDCVIVGLDPGFSFYKLAYATNCIKNGALFIATNRDAAIKQGKFLMPGAGSLVSAIEKSSNCKPIVIGKPEIITLDVIMEENGIKHEDKNKMIMIGDRLETDILFAKNAGIKSCLVLTGVTNENADFREIKPDYMMSQIGDF